MSDFPMLQVGNRAYPDVRALFPDSPAYPKRPLAALNTIVVHHTVTMGRERTQDDELATIRRIYAYHHDHQGWEGIGYHALVFRSGRVYITGGVEDMRAHVLGHNDHTYGVALVGTFQSQAPSDAQLAAARDFVAELRHGLGRVLPLAAHRDFMQTTCPGDTWPQWRGRLERQPAPQPEDMLELLEELRRLADRLEAAYRLQVGSGE